MSRFNIPSKDQVSESNQAIFEDLEKGLGFVPNLYAYYAKSDSGLADYLAFQNRASSLSKKEKEIINLVVSEINGCGYCLSAHTVVAGMNGFTPEQISEIRTGSANFDDKQNALARFVHAVTTNRGQVSNDAKEAFFNAGYTEENLIDVVFNIADKTVSNLIHNITQFEIDFPLAPGVETLAVPA